MWLSIFVKSHYENIISSIHSGVFIKRKYRFTNKIKLAQEELDSSKNSALIIDAPINDEDSITIGDILIDINSESYYRNIEDMDVWNEMNRIL